MTHDHDPLHWLAKGLVILVAAALGALVLLAAAAVTMIDEPIPGYGRGLTDD